MNKQRKRGAKGNDRENTRDKGTSAVQVYARNFLHCVFIQIIIHGVALIDEQSLSCCRCGWTMFFSVKLSAQCLQRVAAHFL